LNINHEFFVDDKSTPPNTNVSKNPNDLSQSTNNTTTTTTQSPINIDLIITPFVSTINSVIDVFNNTSTKVYTGCVKMSNSIGGKIKEYAETMKAYQRTDDDCESLRSVNINSNHKLFIDNLVKTNDPLYKLISTNASNFYKTPFEEQDIELIKILTLMTKSNNKITPLLELKLADL
jgi:hypothetical protein